MSVENEILTLSDPSAHSQLINANEEETTEAICLEVPFQKEHVGDELQATKDASVKIQVDDDEDLEEAAEDDAKVAQKATNSYAAKKTVAQGMMDIALITANANQLRYIVEFSSQTSTYYLNLILITVSLLLQMAVGVSLIFKGRLDLRGESKVPQAKRINNFVVVGIFLVTIINVFIASFTITSSNKQ